MQKRSDLIEEGQQAYQEWRDNLLANPEFRATYEEEAAKKEIWLQLVEARQEAGLTQVELARRLGVSQAQVARMEKRGYDAYSLNSWGLPMVGAESWNRNLAQRVLTDRGRSVSTLWANYRIERDEFPRAAPELLQGRKQ